jgi:hypothetical protein
VENTPGILTQLNFLCMPEKNKTTTWVKSASEEMNIFCAQVNTLRLYIAFRMNEHPICQ